MKSKLPLLMTLAIVVSPIAALGGCSSRYERGGKCWDTPDKGGSPMPCAPPGTWFGDDGDVEPDDAGADAESDAGAGGHR